MSSFFAGGLLILLLQLPIVLRPFFFKKPRIDSILMFLPFSVIIMILYLFAFGLQFFSLMLLVLVLLIFFTNFRAMLRLKNKLFVDNYHLPFIITSVLETGAVIWLGVMLMLYRPSSDMKLSLSFENEETVSHTVELYTGDIYNGFQQRAGLFNMSDAILTVYSPEPATVKDDVVFLVLGGCCADVSDYAPLLNGLAEEGYISMGLQANSYDSDATPLGRNNVSRAFLMRLLLIQDKAEYQVLNDEYRQKKIVEAARLLEIAEEKYPDSRFIFISDDFPYGMVEKAFPDITNIPLALNGCGLIVLTKPLEAAMINTSQWGLKHRAENQNLTERLESYILKQAGLVEETGR